MKIIPVAIDYNDLVKEDRVHGRVYTDPEIFEEEMDEGILSGLGVCRSR